MLDKLYITPRQWLHFLRWSLYCAVLLLAMMLQTVVFGNRTLLGVHPDLVPIVITCVCLREGAERGGLFALLSSVFWALSGIDYGSLHILILTVLPIAGSLLSSRLLSNRFFPCFFWNLFTLLVLQSVIFVFQSTFSATDGSLYFTRLLPCVCISALLQPVFYWLVKCIEKIGDKYESI